MLAKRKILLVLLALLAFVSTNSFAITAIHTPKDSKIACVYDNTSTPENNESVSTVQSLLNISVRGAEHFSVGYKNLQNGKNFFSYNFIEQTSRYSNAYYSVYLLNITNSLKENPFYIAYHRLTI